MTPSFETLISLFLSFITPQYIEVDRLGWCGGVGGGGGEGGNSKLEFITSFMQKIPHTQALHNNSFAYF